MIGGDLLESDGLRADRAWRSGDIAAAIEAADHALARGDDPQCLAAGVAAAAAAADGGLFDAAERWRAVASTLDGAPGALAGGRGALAASVVGDVESAERDLAAARQMVSGAAPRGLTVLLSGVAATLEALRGEFDAAARRLAGLAVATVPEDPMSSERWEDLAVTVMVAGGDDRTAWEMLTAHPDRPRTTRRRLLKAWLDLRTGRLADARAGLAAAGDQAILRRDAVLAAAVTVGLARRAGDEEALRAAWHRVAPVLAGADVEVLLLDAWGELSTAAALVAPGERDAIVAVMAAAVARAGSPAWGEAMMAWWAVQRAVVADEPTAAEVAAAQLAALDCADERTAAARVWASILSADAEPAAAIAAAEALADAGRPWEGAALCGAAAAKLSEAGDVRELLAAGRALRATIRTDDRGGAAAHGLSKRERSVGELLLDGLTQKEIGARLYISPKTVEQHVARLRQKLVAGNRAELVAALRARLAVK
ncbi:MAG TPA: helix-turn-helix transcriptional regulator [Actinophytocola sp.]|jgi:DNA-binding CsgD family transcriptional regulator|uniref:helix-turn-helix transcriptional regulator n=1 Tax=Actinophytocola sp. TaxID=1872138 RepID=UPI002F92EBFF